jgi:hypothetical protein
MYIFTYLEFNLMRVNLDYCSEQDMIKKFRVGLALQPVGNGILLYFYFIFYFFIIVCSFDILQQWYLRTLPLKKGNQMDSSA